MSETTIKQYCANYSDKVSELLEPLRKMCGIDTLFYTVLFPDQRKAFFLSNNFEVADKIISFGQYSRAHNKVLATTQKGSTYRKFIWPHSPDPSNKVGNMLKSYGLLSGMTLLYYNSEDIIMNVGFGSKNDDNNIMDFFLNHDDLLLDFIKFFETELSPVLKNRQEQAVDFDNQFDRNCQLISVERLHELYSSIQKGGEFFNYNKKFYPTPYSKKDYLYLFLLNKGWSIENICEVLEIPEDNILSCLEKYNISRCSLKEVFNKKLV